MDAHYRAVSDERILRFVLHVLDTSNNQAGHLFARIPLLSDLIREVARFVIGHIKNEDLHAVVDTILLHLPHLNSSSIHALDIILRVAIPPDVGLVLVKIDEQLVRLGIYQSQEVLV